MNGESTGSLRECVTCNFGCDDPEPRLIDLRELLELGISHIRLTVCPPRSRPVVKYELLTQALAEAIEARK